MPATVNPNDSTALDFILAATRQIESSNNYAEPPNSANASGAYQFIPSTWQSLTKQYNIGTQYDEAYKAPPAIQDIIAKNWTHDILVKSKGDVSAVPGTWNPTAGPSYTAAFMKAYKNLLAKGVVIDTATALHTGEPQPFDNNANDPLSWSDAIGQTVKEGAGSVADVISSPLDFLKLLSKSSTWVRVLYVVGGVGIIGWGLFALANHNGAVTDAAKTAVA